MMKALSEDASEFPRKPPTISTGQPVASRIGTRFHPIGKRRLPMSMPTTSHPAKHLVREYLERRVKDNAPPPSPEEIRRQLGWGMMLHSVEDDKMGSSRN
jgi:hypothetical protein